MIGSEGIEQTNMLVIEYLRGRDGMAPHEVERWEDHRCTVATWLEPGSALLV